MTTISIDLRTKDVMMSCDICQDVTLTTSTGTFEEIDKKVQAYKEDHKHVQVQGGDTG